jgi:hypothetical protein
MMASHTRRPSEVHVGESLAEYETIHHQGHGRHEVRPKTHTGLRAMMGASTTALSSTTSARHTGCYLKKRARDGTDMGYVRSCPAASPNP